MSIHVLTVDDSRTICDRLHLALTGVGYRVTLAENGQQALDLLETETPDAIMSDINRPNLDGLGLKEAVRHSPHHRATPILMLTTESAPELKLRARGWGDRLDCQTRRTGKAGHCPSDDRRVTR